MAFALSARSKSRLSGVHPDLKRVVLRALELTEIDFTILEGRRSKARQQELFLAEASKTMNSRHLTGHAVDLGAYVAGELRWDWPLYFKLAAAMRDAARELNVHIEWGGCWTEPGDDLEGQVADYVKRKKDRGKKPLMDGPHFQLPWKGYPA